MNFSEWSKKKKEQNNTAEVQTTAPSALSSFEEKPSSFAEWTRKKAGETNWKDSENPVKAVKVNTTQKETEDISFADKYKTETAATETPTVKTANKNEKTESTVSDVLRTSDAVQYDIDEWQSKYDEKQKEVSQLYAKLSNRNGGSIDSYKQLQEDYMAQKRELDSIKETLDGYKSEKETIDQADYEEMLANGYREADWGDILVKGVKQGMLNSQYGKATYEDMMSTDRNAAEQYKKQLESDEYKFTTNSKLKNALLGVANQLGQQIYQWTDPRSVAAGAAAAGAVALAGQAGPQVLLPEEVITVPGAFVAGIQAGSTVSNFEIEAGFAYNEMIENGISEDTAKAIANVVGLGNAALEFVQLDELAKSFKVLKSTGATKSTAKLIGEELLRRGLDVANETVQEVAQESVTIAGAQAASKIETGDWAYSKEEVGERLGETGVSSAITFGIMNVPGGAHNVISVTRDGQTTTMDTQDVKGVLESAGLSKEDAAELAPEIINNEYTATETDVASEQLASPSDELNMAQSTTIPTTQNVVSEAKIEAPKVTATQTLDIMAPALGENGGKALTAAYDGSVDTLDYAREFTQVYNASKNETAIPETAVLNEYQKLAAISAGENDSQVVTSKLEDTDNGEEVYLRKSSEWNDSQDTGSELRTLEEDSRRNQGWEEISGPADREAINLTYGEKVSTASLGIGKGSTTVGIRIVTGGTTTSINKAKAIAKSHHLNLTLFAGGYLQIGGRNAEAYISGDRVFVRADDPNFTAEQLMIHEATHDKIANNEIDLDKVRERIEEISNGETEQFAELYAEAYRDSGLTADEIFEEMVCDSEARINRFSEGMRTLEKPTEAYMANVRKAIREQHSQEIRAPSNNAENFSIAYTNDNVPFVVVEEDILAGVPKNDWRNKVKNVLKERFPNGVKVSGREIEITRKSRKELTYSQYTRDLYNNAPEALADKFRALNNADELILASREYINEGMKHERNDNIRQFARGNVLFEVGGKGYKADVIVGYTSENEMLLYDIVDISRAEINKKAEESNGVLSRRNDSTADSNISQNAAEVKGKMSAVPETEYERQVNEVMTMAQAKRMIEATFNSNDIKEWYDGKYKTAEAWLAGEGVDEVAMYAENSEEVIENYINKSQALMDYEVTIEDVLEAYVNQTLRGPEKKSANRIDISKSSGYEDNRFFAPKVIENAKAKFDIAGQKINKSNNAEVINARKEIIFFAHNANAAEALGITNAELNKKLQSWSRYPARAKQLSQKINEGVAFENQWTGIQNSAILSTATVSDTDIAAQVKEIKGDSSEYQRNYIGKTMLALDTHIDWGELTFSFEKTNNADDGALGYYDDKRRYISIGKAGYLNTVAHEMGHALDHKWTRDILVGNVGSAIPLSENNGLTRERFKSEEAYQFYNNFQLFYESLRDSGDLKSGYTQRGTETFARFIAKFVEWTDKVAGNSFFNENTHYKDKFTTAQFMEFAKLLQEKARVDAVQNEVSEGKLSAVPDYGYHAGDLGKSTMDDWASQGYGRHTGHFGFGTYFVGNQEQISSGNYGKRPRERVDFSNYNLFAPRNEDSGYRLHDALRFIDGYIEDIELMNMDIEQFYDWKHDVEKAMQDTEYDEVWNDKAEVDANRRVVDEFISEMPEYYTDKIESDAKKRYESAQTRSLDRETVLSELRDNYEWLRFSKDLYASAEDYAKENIGREIEWRERAKKYTEEDYKYMVAPDTISKYIEDRGNERNKFSNLVFELRSSLGFSAFSEQRITEALQKTAEIVSNYDHTGRVYERGLDSAATVFMKELGYEGVDVRGLKGLDNTGYGSVIYDLKGDDLARKQEIGTAKYSTAASKSMTELREENAALKEKLKQFNSLEKRAENAERQLTKTEKPTLRKDDVAKFAKSLVSNFNSDVNLAEITKKVQALGDYIVQDGDNGVLAYEDVKDRAIDIAREIVENASELSNADSIEVIRSIRNYLRGNKFYFDNMRGFNESVPGYLKNDKEYRKGKGEIADYKHFHAKNLGRFTLTTDKNATQIDDAWSELQGMYGTELFPEEINTVPDMVLHISDLLDNIEPVYTNPYDYDMASVIEWQANRIVDGLIDESVRQTAPTYADKMERKLAKQKYEDAKKYEAALKRVNEKREKQIAALKERYKQRDAQRKERTEQKAIKERITTHSKKLLSELMKPTDKKHVPEALKGSVARVLESINQESIRSYDANGKLVKGTEGTPTKRTLAFVELKKELSKISGDLVIDPDLLGGDGVQGDLDLVIEMADIPLDAMTTEQLKTVDSALRAVEAAVKTANKLFSSQRFATITDAAEAIKSENIMKKTPVQLKGVIGNLQRLTGLDMMTPEAWFHRLGESGDSLFRAYRNAQDDYITIIKDASEYSRKMFEASSVKIGEAEKTMHTVTLGGQEAKLSTAQLMELYNLYCRGPQAIEHMIYGGGLFPEATNTKGLKKNTVAEPYRGVTIEELAKAISYLTPDEIVLADNMRHFLGRDMAAYGNEASMAVYNYKKFDEGSEYWPIRVNKQDVKTDPSAEQNTRTSLPNKGFTKQTAPHANNSVKIGSAFDTFSAHVADMATYSAYLEVSEDLTRILNYNFRDAEGVRTGTVKGVLDRVFGSGGSAYLSKLMSDVSMGIQAEREYMGGFTANYKAAAVGQNLRVLIQQPTAILRAGDMIDYKYLIGGIKPSGGWKKAVKYAPIAQWKDWGYFDINTGRQLKDILFDNPSILAKAKEISMAGAGKMDSVAWGQLWNACELETKAEHKELTVGSEEYYEHVKNRFTEIVDHTQVVDGVLQRSQIMRSGSGLTKMATSFMGEPTKQYNMFMSAVNDARTATTKDDKSKAGKRLAGTLVALLVSGLVNAAAQSIVDALRDDDREKKYWERWLASFTGLTGEEKTVKDVAKGLVEGNAPSIVNPTQYIPYVKDVFSIVQGYDVTRMDMESIEKSITSVQNFVKALSGEGKYTVSEASANLFAETSRLVGIPVYNIKRDVYGIANTIAIETDNYLMEYRLAKASKSMNYSGNSGTYYDILYSAYTKDPEAYQIIYSDMIKGGFTEEKIKSAMENRMKKEAGVSSVKELAQRYLTPEQTKQYNNTLSEVKKSNVWQQATETQRKSLEDNLYTLLAETSSESSDGTEMQAKIDGGASVGLTETEYLLYQLALKMVDKPNKNGNYGTHTDEEKKAAAKKVGLSEAEYEYLK